MRWPERGPPSLIVASSSWAAAVPSGPAGCSTTVSGGRIIGAQIASPNPTTAMSSGQRMPRSWIAPIMPAVRITLVLKMASGGASSASSSRVAAAPHSRPNSTLRVYAGTADNPADASASR